MLQTEVNFVAKLCYYTEIQIMLKHQQKLRKWKNGMEAKGFRVNAGDEGHAVSGEQGSEWGFW